MQEKLENIFSSFFCRFLSSNLSKKVHHYGLGCYESWTIQYKRVHSGAGSFTDCDASQRCFIFELCPLIHVALNSWNEDTKDFFWIFE